MGYEEIQVLAIERQKVIDKLKYIKTEKTIEELSRKYDELTEKIIQLMTKKA